LQGFKVSRFKVSKFQGFKAAKVQVCSNDLTPEGVMLSGFSAAHLACTIQNVVRCAREILRA
jgi:hypothetical protein